MVCRLSRRGSLNPDGAWSNGPLECTIDRNLRDATVILRDVLQWSKDEVNQTVRTRRTVCLSTTRPGTGGRHGANVTNQCRLSIEGLVGLRQVVGEECGHRQLDHLLELSFQVANRLREIPRDSAGRLEERPDPGREFLPQVADVLQADGDDSIPEEVTRLRPPDAPRECAVRGGGAHLPPGEPVQSVHLELHPSNLLDVSLCIAGDDAERELLHPRREIVETSEEAVNGEPCRLDEVFDRDELGALVHDREASEAAHRLVNFLQLARGELLTTPEPDRVAADDVVPSDHPRQRLGPAPFVRVDRRFRGDRILLKGTDANAETAVVLDREADERTGPNAVRRRPVFREGHAEARVSKLLDLPGFQLHVPCKYGTPPNTYAVRPMAAALDGRPFDASNQRRPANPWVSARSDRILPKPHESRRNRTEAMDRQVDVLVVGAGPTGSTAAKYAALGGADVLLIEKRSEIGTPVRCGEGVAKRWLAEIGLTPNPEVICYGGDGAGLIPPHRTTPVLAETPARDQCGYILERDLFGRLLA